MRHFMWWNGLNDYLKKIYNSKAGRILIKVFLCLFLISFGGLLYHVFLSNAGLSPIQKLGVLLSTTIAAIGVTLLLLERIFRIEVQARQLELTKLQIETQSIDNKYVSEKISGRIIELISKDLVSKDSIYEVRATHYSREKVVLAESFVNLLGERITCIKNYGIKNIQIIVDSGTTLSPIFDVLGNQASQTYNHWSENVELYTNSIRGVQFLMKYREKTLNNGTVASSTNRYAEVPVKCFILPGKILSAYSATADMSTINAINKLGNKERTYTICVTTGNYVLYDSNKRVFMPIARTGFHPHIKAILYHISNELYVVAPLGKILKGELSDSLDTLKDKFNNDLDYNASSHIASKKDYSLITHELLPHIIPETDLNVWHAKSILITSKRRESNLFYHHYKRLVDNMKPFKPNEKQFEKNDTNGPFFWASPYDDIPILPSEQLNCEVPHSNLRPFLDKYFGSTGTGVVK